MFLILSAWLLLLAVALERRKKTIVLFGIAGVGKSTIGNCLLSGSGDAESIQGSSSGNGFDVSEDAASGTLEFQTRSNERYTLIDSIGFGSTEFNASYILDEMRSVLAAVDNKVDHVLFVILQGRLTNDTFELIRHFQHDILRNKSAHNSALIVNKCGSRGWLHKPKQRDNPWLQLILQSVNNVAHEFDLKMDHALDDDDDRARNRDIRQRSIDDLVAFLDRNESPHGPMLLDHIQTREFEHSWYAYIFKYMSALATRLLASLATSDSTQPPTSMSTSSRKPQQQPKQVVEYVKLTYFFPLLIISDLFFANAYTLFVFMY